MEHYKGITKLISEGAVQVGCQLNQEVLSKFEIYFKELRLWNEKVNLTGLSAERDIAVTLFIDSLACGLALSPGKNESIVDIGSGAGFPGIPLKIAYPQLNVTLIEPRLKKTAFLRHIIGTLGLGQVEVLPRRIDDLAKDSLFEFRYDRIVTKALRAEYILPFAGSLLRDLGKVVLCRSEPFNFSSQEFGMRLVKEISYELPYGFGKRNLSILEPIRIF